MNKIREQFEAEYVHSFWNKIMFWFLRRKVRREKLLSLYEANLDKLYLETQYAHILAYSDVSDREQLAAENRKPLAEQDKVTIDSLEDKIAKAKAIKQSWRTNKSFRQETKDYLMLLDLWDQDEPEAENKN